MGRKAQPRAALQFLDDGTVRVPLTKGLFAIVDKADLPLISGRPWYAVRGNNGSVYARRACPGGEEHMHRVIVGITDPAIEVDHRDGQTLRNVGSNLRVCKHLENSRNTRKHRDASSRFKGVCWNKRSRKWQANIFIAGRLTHLGLFSEEVLAARSYDKVARAHFGEFARLNFV